MGDVVSRGTRDKPRWYIRFKDADGVRRMLKVAGAATKKEALAALAKAETNVREGRPGMASKSGGTFGEALVEYLEARTARAKDADVARATRWIIPTLGKMTIGAAQELPVVLGLLKKLTASGLGPDSIRAILRVLSLGYQHFVATGRAQKNPVVMIPREMRPKQKSSKADHPYLRTDEDVRRVYETFDGPMRVAFWLGARCGLRPGEIAGLRLGDVQWCSEGTIRVMRSFDDLLKEDHDGKGIAKWVPCPSDWTEVLQPLIAARRAAGAGDDDLLLLAPAPRGGRPRKSGWAGLTNSGMDRAWEKVRDQLGLDEGMRWYDAGRHTFVSRNLEAGVPIDEVSAAVGHSSVLVTRASYNHFVRKTWSPTLLRSLEVGAPKPDPSAVANHGKLSTAHQVPHRRDRDAKE